MEAREELVVVNGKRTVSRTLVAHLAEDAGFPRSEIPNVVAHAECESSMDPSAINSSGHIGLMQIWKEHWDNPVIISAGLGFASQDEFIKAMLDSSLNLKAAYALWKDAIRTRFLKRTDGYGPWYETIACRNTLIASR